MRILLQGDTHGRVGALNAAFKAAENEGAERIIVMGDFGYGWDGDYAHGSIWLGKASRFAKNFGIDLWWFDGNHENFDLLEENGFFGSREPVEVAPLVTYIPRGYIMEFGEKRVMAIGGAYSVDEGYRIPHKSWWPQEQITKKDLDFAVQQTEEKGLPDVVLSHDVPDIGFQAALGIGLTRRDMEHLVWKNDQQFPKARPNRMALQGLYDFFEVKPERWVHGHYHSSYRAQVGRTTFSGLAHENFEISREVIVV